MPANFDWETEESHGREQAAWDYPPDAGPGPSRQRQWPWRTLGAIAGLLLVLGLVVFWRVQERVADAMQIVRDDVVASHNLIQRAAIEGDEELFRTLLSGRDPSWTAAQLELMDEGLFFDRSALQLKVADPILPAMVPERGEETAAGAAMTELKLSPDLTEAVVMTTQPYTAMIDGREETVMLRQANVYRRGDLHWLLAPPQPEFWGDWLRWDGEYLTVLYPQRDRELSERLAADLDGAVDDLCSTIRNIGCPDDLRISVRFARDPNLFDVLASGVGRRLNDRLLSDEIELPAPTLVGVPAPGDRSEELAYAALARGYTRQLLTFIIGDLVAWECCNQEAPFTVLLDHQLHELGYGDWPVTSAEYQRILDERIRLSDMGGYWSNRRLPAQDIWQLYTAVDFLLHVLPDASAADMQRLLRLRSGPGDYLSRLLSDYGGDLGENSWILSSLEHAWWLFAWQGAIDVDASEVALSEDELYLACTTTGATQRPEPSRLLRYDPSAQNWEALYTLDGFIWMIPLPDPETLLLQEFLFQSESWQTSVWRDDARATLYGGARDYAVSLGETDPEGGNLLIHTFGSDFDDGQGRLLELAGCDEGCQTRDVPGIPYWSPGGDWVVFAGDNQDFGDNRLVMTDDRRVIIEPTRQFVEMPLALRPANDADTDQSVELGLGYAPFWLDERTYGFIRRADRSSGFLPPNHELVLGAVGSPELESILTSADLQPALPDVYFDRRAVLAYAASHPAHPGQLFVTALDGVDRSAFVFRLDLETRQPELLLHTRSAVNHSLSFSPDGRYLVVTGRDRNLPAQSDSSGVILLHDLRTGETLPFINRLPFFLSASTFDWSSDGRWLAIAMDDNLVGLVAPEAGQAVMLPHSYGACTSVGWLER